MADEPEQPPRLRKVVGQSWHKDKRIAQLSCGHSIEVSLREAMPYEALCPTCDAPPDRPTEDA